MNTSLRWVAGTAMALASLLVWQSTLAQNAAKVCFYEHVGFQGASYCASPGLDTADADGVMINNQLQSWNKRISSIQIVGGAKVTIWEGKNYSGPSITLTRSVDDMQYIRTKSHGVRNWNDALSSYKTHY